MRELAQIIKELREKKGPQTAVAAKLKVVTSQQLGSYERGDYKPKADFFEAWKREYGEDILAIQKGNVQRNVSHETENGTDVPDQAAINKKDPEEHIRILIKNLDRMGELNEYLLKEIKRLQGN